ncbi:MAG: hypothetical protein AAGJ81_08065 [Verrucomicrobiota bacterium]
MNSIRLHHYYLAILACSAYCTLVIHIWPDRVPSFIDHSAHYLALPIILPFMLHMETKYLTPAVVDFPYFIAAYPVYFGLILSPIAFLALKNERKSIMNSEEPQTINTTQIEQ